MIFGHKEGYPQPRIFRAKPIEASHTFTDEFGRKRVSYYKLPPTSPASLYDTNIYRPFDLLLRDARFIKDRYGMEVKLGRKDAQDIKEAAIERPNPVNAAEAAIVLREELARYPSSYIKHCRVTRVRLVSAYKMPRKGKADQMHEYGGAAFREGPIYIVHYPNDILYTGGTMHHELWHRSDQNSSRHLGVLGLAPIIRWLWIRNNPPSAYLGDKYWDLTDKEIRGLDIRGFAIPYGRANYDEDRATVAEGLMNYTAPFFYRCKGDPVLARKLKLTMFDYWLKSGGLMNRNFFDDLSRGKVNGEAYWDSKLGQKPEASTPFYARPSVLVAASILLSVGLALRENQKVKIK